MEGKHILDAALRANEIVDELKYKNLECMSCKLDMKKIEDHENWSFLDYMLERMRVGGKWCKWIIFCYEGPLAIFKTNCGLR